MQQGCRWVPLPFVMLLLLAAAAAKPSTPPHIVFVVADDLGWNDVGFHGSLQIPTPNIDAMAYSGVILNNYYVQPICTPSRSCIMTGMHPIHTGLQHDVIYPATPYGVPVNITMLPEYLKNVAEYSTVGIGKWHLGMCERDFTPNLRGFDQHFGYWTGHVDYYDHTAEMSDSDMWGYDFWRNMEVAHDAYGLYATDLFTNEALSAISSHNNSRPLFLYLAHLAVHSGNSYDPLQAPQEYIDRYSYIEDENRRKFAGMLAKLDESVGDVVTALDARGMLDNTIFIFTTDNGGAAGGFNLNAASNWPLRGVKATFWEGGLRGAAFVWSPFITQAPGTVSHEMMTIEDWLPSLYTAAGGDVSDLAGIDGKNLWPSISTGAASPRQQLLHSIDPVFDGVALRKGDWKLVYNPSWYGKEYDTWFGPSGRNESAPETQLPAVLQQIRDCPAGKVVLKRNPRALDGMAETRLLAQVNCTKTPIVPSFYCRSTTPVSPCLFNIVDDPCEQHDVSKQNPDIVTDLLELLEEYNSTAVPILNQPWDPAADPKYWGYNWVNWMDFPTPVQLRNDELSNVVEAELPHENLFDFFKRQ